MPLERKHIPPQGEVFGLAGGTPNAESDAPPNLSGWTLLPSVPKAAESSVLPAAETQTHEQPPVAESTESS